MKFKLALGVGISLLCMAVSCVTSKPGSLPQGVVAKVPGDQRPVTILKTEYDAGKKEASAWFESSLGIFAFSFEPGDMSLQSIQFIIKQQKFSEGLTFYPKSGGEIDLRRAEGVNVCATNNAIHIKIVPPALNTVKNGGRFQYVNFYR